MNLLNTLVERLKPIQMDIVRVYLGLFISIKGIEFLIHPEAFASIVQGNQILILESLLAHYIIIIHLAGGLLLMLGLLTRIAAFFQIPIILGAISLIHYKEGLFGISQSLEYTSIILILLLLIGICGPGKLSLDAIVEKNHQKNNPKKNLNK